MESDLWLYGVADLLVKSGCFQKGCAVLVKGDPGDGSVSARLIVTHELVDGVPLADGRTAVNMDVIRALGRRDQFGITGRLIERLRAAHGEGG
jgi:hypothetical protein